MSDMHDWSEGWPPPTSRPPSRQRSSDTEPDWLIGDMRERLATLEAGHRHTIQFLRDRAHSQAARMSRIDDRLTEGDRRMTEGDGRLAALEADRRRCQETEAGLKALSDRVLTIEQWRAAMLGFAQYAAAAVILGLTFSGKLDAEAAVKAILRLLGLPV